MVKSVSPKIKGFLIVADPKFLIKIPYIVVVCCVSKNFTGVAHYNFNA